MTYQECKAFLKDAVIERRYSDPCVCNTVWRKPDGSRWQECESRLEFPEDDYSLKQIVEPRP